MVSVCLVNVDYYMSYPIKDLDVNYSEFRGSEVRQVPVIQIFGSTSTGKKACLHVHGVFPYIYIPYDGSESAEKLSYKIALELDNALNISLGQSSSNAQHVNNVVLVSGIPMYGFHEKEHQFFKIYFYNPGIVKKACSLLENGQVLDKIFQPHESHINYILQFMIDYNLHGMSYINLSHVKYRYDPQKPFEVSQELILPSSVQKRSFSQLEMDGFECDILNRFEIISGQLTVNPGLAALWEEEKQRKRNKDLTSQISFCLTQDRERVPQTSTHKYFKQLLIEKLKKKSDNKIDKNVSVYPIETPENSEILSASSTHSVTLENTFDSQDLDETILPLYEVLCDLQEENRIEENTIEEDSILSQQVKENDNSEDELNLTMPNDEWNNSFWDNVRISQVDGAEDSSDTDTWTSHDTKLTFPPINSVDENFESVLKCVVGNKKLDFYLDDKYIFENEFNNKYLLNSPFKENYKKRKTIRCYERNLINTKTPVKKYRNKKIFSSCDKINFKYTRDKKLSQNAVSKIIQDFNSDTENIIENNLDRSWRFEDINHIDCLDVLEDQCNNISNKIPKNYCDKFNLDYLTQDTENSAFGIFDIYENTSSWNDPCDVILNDINLGELPNVPSEIEELYNTDINKQKPSNLEKIPLFRELDSGLDDSFLYEMSAPMYSIQNEYNQSSLKSLPTIEMIELDWEPSPENIQSNNSFEENNNMVPQKIIVSIPIDALQPIKNKKSKNKISTNEENVSNKVLAQRKVMKILADMKSKAQNMPKKPTKKKSKSKVEIENRTAKELQHETIQKQLAKTVKTNEKTQNITKNIMLNSLKNKPKPNMNGVLKSLYNKTNINGFKQVNNIKTDVNEMNGTLKLKKRGRPVGSKNKSKKRISVNSKIQSKPKNMPNLTEATIESNTELTVVPEHPVNEITLQNSLTDSLDVLLDNILYSSKSLNPQDIDTVLNTPDNLLIHEILNEKPIENVPNPAEKYLNMFNEIIDNPDFTPEYKALDLPTIDIDIMNQIKLSREQLELDLQLSDSENSSKENEKLDMKTYDSVLDNKINITEMETYEKIKETQMETGDKINEHLQMEMNNKINKTGNKINENLQMEISHEMNTQTQMEMSLKIGEHLQMEASVEINKTQMETSDKVNETRIEISNKLNDHLRMEVNDNIHKSEASSKLNEHNRMETRDEIIETRIETSDRINEHPRMEMIVKINKSQIKTSGILEEYLRMEASDKINKTRMETSDKINETQMEKSEKINKPRMEISNKIDEHLQMEASDKINETRLETSNKINVTRMEKSEKINDIQEETGDELNDIRKETETQMETGDKINEQPQIETSDKINEYPRLEKGKKNNEKTRRRINNTIIKPSQMEMSDEINETRMETRSMKKKKYTKRNSDKMTKIKQSEEENLNIISSLCDTILEKESTVTINNEQSDSGSPRPKIEILSNVLLKDKHKYDLNYTENLESKQNLCENKIIQNPKSSESNQIYENKYIPLVQLTDIRYLKKPKIKKLHTVLDGQNDSSSSENSEKNTKPKKRRTEALLLVSSLNFSPKPGLRNRTVNYAPKKTKINKTVLKECRVSISAKEKLICDKKTPETSSKESDSETDVPLVKNNTRNSSREFKGFNFTEINICGHIEPKSKTKKLNRTKQSKVLSDSKLTPKKNIDIECSSSSDEFVPVVKLPVKSPIKSPRRSRRKVSESPKYTPLNIVVSSPRKSGRNYDEQVEMLRKKAKIFDTKVAASSNLEKNDSKTETNSTVGEFEGHNFLQDKTTSTKEEIKTKKLNSKTALSDIISPSINKTIIEEKQICNYKKSNKIKTRRISYNSEQIYREKEDKFLEELLNDQKPESRKRSNSLSISVNIIPNPYHVAEKYDRDHNFVPQPCGSKTLDQTELKQSNEIGNAVIVSDLSGNNYISQSTQKSEEFDLTNLENPEFILKQIAEFENYTKKMITEKKIDNDFGISSQKNVEKHVLFTQKSDISINNLKSSEQIFSSQGYGKDSQEYGKDNQDYGKDSQEYGKDGQDYGRDSQDYGKVSQDYGKNSQDYGKISQDYEKDSQSLEKYFGVSQSLDTSNSQKNTTEESLERIFENPDFGKDSQKISNNYFNKSQSLDISLSQKSDKNTYNKSESSKQILESQEFGNSQKSLDDYFVESQSLDASFSQKSDKNISKNSPKFSKMLESQDFSKNSQKSLDYFDENKSLDISYSQKNNTSINLEECSEHILEIQDFGKGSHKRNYNIDKSKLLDVSLSQKSDKNTSKNVDASSGSLFGSSENGSQKSSNNYFDINKLDISNSPKSDKNVSTNPGKLFEIQKNNLSHANNVDITVENNFSTSNYKILVPKYNPPTVTEIKSTFSENNIPKIRFVTPYYSDPKDVTGKIDIGHNVLKIPSNTTKDLDEFKSCINFPGLDNWRKELLETNIGKTNVKLLLSSSDKVVLTPIKQPPTRLDVIEWVKNRVTEEKIKLKPAKIRIHIPMSPGNDSMDETLTMSPCSPLDTNETLKSFSVDTTPISPALNRRDHKKGSLQRRALFSNLKNLPDKTSQNSDSSDIIPNSQPDIQSKLPQLNLSEETKKHNDSCQITGVTLNNTHGFKMSCENLQEAKALNLCPDLTVMVLEIHTQARGDLTPDPEYDSIRAIFYCILSDTKGESKQETTGIIAVDMPGSPNPKAFRPPILNGMGVDCEITYTKSETGLFDEFIKLIRKWDPDIFAGYEIELFSWGYLIQRGYKISLNIPILISRLNPVVKQRIDNEDHDIKIPGRIVLDIWRLLRHEIALTNYTFENIMYHILHQRVPLHSYKDLSFFWEHRSNNYRHITVKYYLNRVIGILKILDQLDLIGRTCELAKLFGIQFYEVLSRGSQFRVESIMLRLAKPQNYIPVSPSVQQRARMRAPEFLPLILEPESRLYVDPVIVLDFQSLYPSIIIAHNYCFTTCIGRVEKLGSSHPFEFGATQLKISPKRLEKLIGRVNFSPCGVGYVKPEVRKGILPKMLTELLETRLMVKNSMKENKDNKLLQRVLHSRQLGLKYIANFTYGYTAANFSGRMPCIEVGDSVVSKGRETLERAIRLIENNKEWNVRVVYGDTDSLFVLAEGRTRQEAFQIGSEIAEAVTKDNPPPVKLKLEKILQPCILQTKKRYVGYMYESPDQTEPEYLAKGIETVRRDGCPAVAKMLEKCLRMLFETCDVSLIKKYVVRQFGKILSGRASIQDLIFAKEYRGASGYKPGACVPALELARKWKTTDARKEPRRGQRVPYIIVNGPPGVPLIRLVRSPSELLADPGLHPNALYYITKVIIPPINRCFTLFGADLNIWFNEMPRKQIQYLPTELELLKNKKSTISQYFATMSCAVCGNQTRNGLCEICMTKPQETVVALNQKVLGWERNFSETNQICQSCCSRSEFTDCMSLDCPILYRLNQTKRDLNQALFVRNLLNNF